MNLVNVIKDQFSSQLTEKIAELIGGDKEKTKSALGAVIPALLSAFSKMSSSGSAGDKLAAALNQFDSDAVSKMSNLVSEDPEQALATGNDLLGSLFGSSTLSGLASTLSRFVGVDSSSLKKLLAYVSPMVMGAIAKQFQGKPATAQGLRSLLDDQRDNIASAMPAGFSLADVPGLAEVEAARDSVAGAARRTSAAAEQAESSLGKVLLPLGALALLALLAWNFFGRAGDEDPADQQMAQAAQEQTVQKPVIDSPDTTPPAEAQDATSPEAQTPAMSLPDVGTITQDLQSFYQSATQTLAGITDVESAEAALPELKELGEKVSSLSALQEKLPAAARTRIAQVATENLGKLTEMIEKVTAIPGVGEKLKPILDPIVTKLKAFEVDAAAASETPAESTTP